MYSSVQETTKQNTKISVRHQSYTTGLIAALIDCREAVVWLVSEVKSQKSPNTFVLMNFTVCNKN